jgi:hypothetical protein
MVNIDPGAMSFLTVHQSLPYMDRERGRTQHESVICDGKKLQVTETLFTTLLQLQQLLTSKTLTEEAGMTYFESLPTPRSKYIWIDQICIDQQNLDERSAQVPLMNKIFAAAQYVFAWIGDLDNLGLSGLAVTLDRGRSREPQSRLDPSDTSFERLGKERKDLYALTALLSRQWFRRAWVNSRLASTVLLMLTFARCNQGGPGGCFCAQALPLVWPLVHRLVDIALCTSYP